MGGSPAVGDGPRGRRAAARQFFCFFLCKQLWAGAVCKLHWPELFINSALYFEPAAFLCASQRRLTASAMRFRPSGERRLFFFFFAIFFEDAWAAGGTTTDVFLGLPVFFGAVASVPLSSARTCFSKAISRSTDASISDTPTDPPCIKASSPAVVRLNHRAEQEKPLANGYDRRSNFDLQTKSSPIN